MENLVLLSFKFKFYILKERISNVRKNDINYYLNSLIKNHWVQTK